MYPLPESFPQKGTYSKCFLDRMYELYPVLVDFDKQTGEKALFKEVMDNLWSVLPERLRTPLVLGTLMLRVLNSPDHAGAVVLSVYKEYK